MSERERLNVRISREQYRALKALAESQRVPMGDIVDAALEDYFSPDDYKTASLGFLSRVEEKTNKNQRKIDEVHEMVGRALLVFFMNDTPETGQARFKKFLGQLVQASQTNKTVAEELRQIVEG